MSVEMNSLSSSLMLGVTLFRNQEGVANKIIAEAGYILAAKIAIVETVVAAVFTALSLAVYPISPKPFEQCVQWASSSAFCIGWSIVDAVFNLFTARLVADERSAREILKSGDLFTIPSGAVVR